MNSLVVGGIAFACAFGGAVVGLILRAKVPQCYLSDESQKVVTLGTGLIGTLAALVLGLLIASANSSFDAQRRGFQQMSFNLVVLDRTLAQYGPEAKDARDELRRLVVAAIDRLWPDDASRRAGSRESRTIIDVRAILDRIRVLAPTNDRQRSLRSRALEISSELAKTQWLLYEEKETSIPTPFLIVVIFWLGVIFTSFGLLAPPNPIVIGSLLICALSVGGAVFLIVDLDQRFSGLIQISSASLRDALSQLGQ